MQHERAAQAGHRRNADRALPAHLQLHRGRILSGDWPPGHRVPFEHERIPMCACSRMTVNKVISALAGAGLVEGRRRAATFASRPRAQSAVLEVPNRKSEARGGASATAIKSSSGSGAGHRARTRTGSASPRAAPSWRCATITRPTHAPFAVEDRLLNLRAVPDAVDEDFGTTPPNAQLLGHVPWTEAKRRILASSADARSLAELDVAASEACLVLERRKWRNGEPITSVQMVHPDRFCALIARFISILHAQELSLLRRSLVHSRVGRMKRTQRADCDFQYD